MNTLKINELKRQLRLGALKPAATDTPSGPIKGPGNASRDTKISKDVEQIKKDMRAEKNLEGNGSSNPEAESKNAAEIQETISPEPSNNKPEGEIVPEQKAVTNHSEK